MTVRVDPEVRVYATDWWRIGLSGLPVTDRQWVDATRRIVSAGLDIDESTLSDFEEEVWWAEFTVGSTGHFPRRTLVRCPRCDAPPGQRCRSASGRESTSHTHMARLAAHAEAVRSAGLLIAYISFQTRGGRNGMEGYGVSFYLTPSQTLADRIATGDPWPAGKP